MPRLRASPTQVKVTVGGGAGVNVTVRVSSEQGRTPLRFGQGNAKLDPAIFTFSLPAGHSCKFARECLSRADPKTGQLKDGGQTRFRCYAASMECRRPSVRRSRWHNLNELKKCRTRGEMTRLILDSLTPFAGFVRVHDSGDFFSQAYFDSWVEVAQERVNTTFYAYVKALPFWVARLRQVGDGYEPGEVANFVPTASWGGTRDDLIDMHGLRSARVVFSHAEAEGLNLAIDHDDSHAMRHGPDFALLLHGLQPRGSEAARAAVTLRDAGFTGYGRRLPMRMSGVANESGAS